MLASVGFCRPCTGEGCSMRLLVLAGGGGLGPLFLGDAVGVPSSTKFGLGTLLSASAEVSDFFLLSRMASLRCAGFGLTAGFAREVFRGASPPGA